VPGKADGAAPRKRRRAAAKYRRADADTVRSAIDRLLTLGVGRYSSQAAFLRAFRPALRAEDPTMRIAAPRLRSLLVGTPGVRLLVRYTEQSDAPASSECPVCGAELVPIRNRTLTGSVVALGQRCPRCGYWTHRHRRIPVRYAVQRTGRSSRPRRSPPP
jgi:hypothetical protein